MAEITPFTLAAAQAAGPMMPGEDVTAWAARVKEVAVEMTFLGEEIGEAIARVVAANKPFNATLATVEIQRSSTRGLIAVFTGTEKRYENRDHSLKVPAGHEPLMTLRGDTPDGRRQIEKAKGLIGHKVRVWWAPTKIEDGTGHSFRELVRIVDLGPAPKDANAARPAERQAAVPSQQAAPTPQGAGAPPAEAHHADRNQTTEQGAPAPVESADWPPVAGPPEQGAQQQERMIPVNTVKQHVLAAAHNDKAIAVAAWESIGNPAGSEVRESLATAAVRHAEQLLPANA